MAAPRQAAEDLRPPTQPRALGGLQAGAGAFANKLSLELDQGAHDVEQQPAAGGAGVDRLGDGAKCHAPLPQLGDDLDQMFQAAPEPVQPPDHQGVAGEQRLQELIELRPTVELPDAWSVNSNAASLDKGVLLQRRVLLGRGHAGVAVDVRHRLPAILLRADRSHDRGSCPARSMSAAITPTDCGS